MTWSYKETTFDNCKLGWVIPINLICHDWEGFHNLLAMLNIHFGKTRVCLKTSNTPPKTNMEPENDGF